MPRRLGSGRMSFRRNACWWLRAVQLGVPQPPSPWLEQLDGIPWWYRPSSWEILDTPFPPLSGLPFTTFLSFEGMSGRSQFTILYKHECWLPRAPNVVLRVDSSSLSTTMESTQILARALSPCKWYGTKTITWENLSIDLMKEIWFYAAGEEEKLPTLLQTSMGAKNMVGENSLLWSLPTKI